jgi:hypothetical protein
MTDDDYALARPARVSLDSTTTSVDAIDLTRDDPPSSMSPRIGCGPVPVVAPVAGAEFAERPTGGEEKEEGMERRNKRNKKRSFHDEILYKMLTSCRPYTLKTLASSTNNTIEGLRHAMLSFVDKGLVMCKEFPVKGEGREPKKLYWANTATLSEIEMSIASHGGGGGKKGGGGVGGGAIYRELSKLLSTSVEMNEINDERRSLECKYRSILAELNPLSSIPTLKSLNDEISSAESELLKLETEIEGARERVKSAATTAVDSALGGGDRRPGTTQSSSIAKIGHTTTRWDPTIIKCMINHMLGEYKTRKRKCMDFVEELSEAMEKKIGDVLGDKVLCLDTDEAEWGIWEDGTTGKVYGKKPRQSGGGGGGVKKLGRKNDGGGQEEEEEARVVKIPARYQDV